MLFHATDDVAITLNAGTELESPLCRASSNNLLVMAFGPMACTPEAGGTPWTGTNGLFVIFARENAI